MCTWPSLNIPLAAPVFRPLPHDKLLINTKTNALFS
jgi:hypothetical protein